MIKTDTDMIKTDIDLIKTDTNIDQKRHRYNKNKYTYDQNQCRYDKTDINRSVFANQYIGLYLQEPSRNPISFDFNELHCELLHEYLQSSTLLKENMKYFFRIFHLN